MFDPYKILGIEYGASRSEARTAAHAKLLKYHPDKTKSINAGKLVS